MYTLLTKIGQSKLATGTEALLNDATTWLLVLATVVGIVCIIYFQIRRAAAEDTDQKQWRDRTVTAAICVVVAEVASVIIKVLVSYYQ